MFNTADISLAMSAKSILVTADFITDDLVRDSVALTCLGLHLKGSLTNDFDVRIMNIHSDFGL